MFKNGILGLIPQEDIIDSGFVANRPNNPVDQLFGDEATDNLIVKWQSIAAEYQVPVMAQYHAFDVKTQKTIRVPIDSHNIEKGLIKVKSNTSELLRQLIMHGTPENNERALYDYVMNDMLNLAEQVVTRTKVAKNELLATGKITIAENGIGETVDYGVPAANLSKTLDFGAGASAPIPDQLEDLIAEARSKGQSLAGIYASSAFVNKLRKDANIQKAIYGSNMSGVLVRNADLAAYLGDEFGLSQIISNDLTYSKPYTVGTDGRPVVTAVRFYPQDRATFFTTNTAGYVGSGIWGVPPEIDAARFGGSTVEASSLSGYVYIQQWSDNDPVVLWTKASALFMPVLFNPSGLYVATATATPAA